MSRGLWSCPAERPRAPPAPAAVTRSWNRRLLCRRRARSAQRPCTRGWHYERVPLRGWTVRRGTDGVDGVRPSVSGHSARFSLSAAVRHHFTTYLTKRKGHFASKPTSFHLKQDEAFPGAGHFTPNSPFPPSPRDAVRTTVPPPSLPRLLPPRPAPRGCLEPNSALWSLRTRARRHVSLWCGGLLLTPLSPLPGTWEPCVAVEGALSTLPPRPVRTPWA